MSRNRDSILKLTTKYYKELNDNDFSHNFDHILRVENIAKRIALDEGADMEIVEASCLLFDVARLLEDRGEVEDHAITGSEIAERILTEINFPKEKISDVCHAILVHRRSKDRIPQTIEAKILQDADYLDAMGAVDVARVFASVLQSSQYKKPIYVDMPYDEITAKETSGIHFLLYKLNHPKHQPENFYTRLGKEMTKDRFMFMKEYAERFIAEWRGEK